MFYFLIFLRCTLSLIPYIFVKGFNIRKEIFRKRDDASKTAQHSPGSSSAGSREAAGNRLNRTQQNLACGKFKK